MMKLFWTPASPFVRKVMVAAHELGLAERIEIAPTVWPHSWGYSTVAFDPEFVAANPVARIPTLVTEEGVALPESNLICQYLDSLAGGRLLPPEGRPRWEALRRLAIADGALEALIARRAESLRPAEARSARFVDKQRDRVARCLDAIAADPPSGDDLPDLGVIAAAMVCGYLDFRHADEPWRASRPALAAWYAGFARRPAMRATEHSETPQR